MFILTTQRVTAGGLASPFPPDTCLVFREGAVGEQESRTRADVQGCLAYCCSLFYLRESRGMLLCPSTQESLVPG